MKMPKGFLFDFDGVVVDSANSHFAAWTSAFKELFDKQIPPFPSTHIGKTPMEIAAYFCGTIHKPEQTEALYALKDHHLDIYFSAPKLLPGIREITKFLSDEKIPYGIASNATKQFLKNSVHHLNLNFTTIFGVQDYDKPKPHPEAYITLAKALGFTKDEFKNIWVFEDSLTGTTAAKLAGMTPIGILTQNTEKELKEAGSELIFKTVLEAYEYLIKTN